MNTLFNDEEEFGFSRPSSYSQNKQNKSDNKLNNNQEQKEKEKETETSRSFSSFKQSFMKGPHMIEEVRERSCDSSTGITREITKRRLGNKWVEIEEETGKDGNTKTKETWHNVSEDQTEEFKKLWEEHRGNFGFDHILKNSNDIKSIEHQDKDQAKDQDKAKAKSKDESEDKNKK
ncbi:hypothetical protein TRFO_39211 [Tritrichomonas foetus]|uniref:Uncharacterized protein n=1 Tax=Tritrichomonas foetus TaxID=1144522 RepID=A0A1J4JB49_9EUKA|nr:hypothetical protein TRFO_39210 [Tritrichomonas foetus]OHS94653.1 hypothetical protein TRFO_39211 [Tritrichomonas foetus]|eukprot:OHS94652.1 hypothetical protein TRFO_39210 [Tritrichomonas foetus]